ncbi:PREDICTED: CLAVATA3/ESR (CLE)-related protein 4-like [Tarenaya hassleriana]|uniref:CLAVATA3/ESR (CLE)-related protein 4-like n=1 Tax=Tarenaya hassleriana TaxID=28532 RepID=UPI0008FD40A3|nr:PREDICTED: CLAVATA3/ESR (CLE)-related protein 4-like [Tarenaya hassleriana]
MASFKFWIFLTLLLLEISVHQCRPLLVQGSRSDSASMRKMLRALIERSEELKVEPDGEDNVLSNNSDSKRLSPGGPDPRHH